MLVYMKKIRKNIVYKRYINIGHNAKNLEFNLGQVYDTRTSG